MMDQQFTTILSICTYFWRNVRNYLYVYIIGKGNLDFLMAFSVRAVQSPTDLGGLRK